MYRPPLDTRHSAAIDQPTWRGVVATYLAMAALPVVLWLASDPTRGVVVFAGLFGILAARRRAAGLIRCLRECRQVTVDLGDRVQITITNPHVDDAH